MRPPSDPYELLSVKDSATVLGLTPGQVEHLAHRRLIRFRREGQSLFFERGELERTAQRLAVESAEMAEVP